MSETPSKVYKAYGFQEEMNPRYRRTMEDAHVFFDNAGKSKNGCFFGVFDGHGGTKAVNFARDNMYRNFVDLLKQSPSDAIPKVLADTFRKTDNEMGAEKIEVEGTTAAVILLQREKVGSDEVLKAYSANCGDARSILVRSGKGYRLSFDHKPTLKEEVSRISAAGGFVALGRVNGILAVSRSLGDHLMKKFIICDPFVSESVINPETDEFIIVCCDGVWDVLTDNAVAEIAIKLARKEGFNGKDKGKGSSTDGSKASSSSSESSREGDSSASESLCNAIAKEIIKKSLEQGSTDNISVLVLQL